MDAPYYLQVGNLILEDGTGLGPYFPSGLSFPEPDPDGAGWYRNAIRTFHLKVTGTSAANLSTNIAALRRECVRDKYLYFRPTATGTVLSCLIREASVKEDATDPLRRAQLAAYLTLTFETTPTWDGAWSAEVTPTVDAVPGHFDVTGVTGELDAQLTMRIIPTRNGRGLFVGVKPDPAAGYDYCDDYSGTADANALTTAKATLSATATPTAVGTAPTIDTNANRGRHLVLARMDTTSTTAANNTAKVRVTTTGNAIAASTSVDEAAVAFPTGTDLYGFELGSNVSIPAGAVPNVATGSGWGASGVVGSQATTDGTLVGQTGAGYYTQGFGTLITLAAETQIETLSFWLKHPSASIFWYNCVYKIEGVTDSLPNGTVHASVSALIGLNDVLTEKSVPFGAPVTLPAGTYSIGIYFTAGYASDKVTVASNSAGTGAWRSDADTGYFVITNGYDLKYSVSGKTQLGFNTTMPILAACTESSKTIGLDYAQRVPVDYSAIAYRPSASGSLGLYYDAETDTPYIADADGIGPALYDKVEIRRPLRLKPGVTNRVVLGMLQNDDAVAGATVVYKWRPRYLTAVAE